MEGSSNNDDGEGGDGFNYIHPDEAIYYLRVMAGADASPCRSGMS